MFVTTSLRTTEQITNHALKVANELNLPFKARGNQPISALHAIYQCDVLVVSAGRLSLFQYGVEEPMFFHPNSAMFRVKRFLRGESDPLIEAAKLTEKMSMLDCTMGLASDSILSSVVVGKNGHVVGVEGNRTLSYIVRQGLSTWKTGHPAIDEAMQRIEVVQSNNLQYLLTLKDNSFDVVYFDPMFEVELKKSTGINKIRNLALYNSLDEETIEEAKRVARHRVVLKDHWKSSRFERFRFNVYKRRSSEFHYAAIEL